MGKWPRDQRGGVWVSLGRALQTQFPESLDVSLLQWVGTVARLC